MDKLEMKSIRILSLAALMLAVGVPVHASGFLLFEQGAKGMGMGGAFTAQADDPSALFHNVAGIAFQKERDFLAGFTWYNGSVDFEGAAPFPGPGVTEKTESLSEFPPHFYWVEPVGRTWTFGLGLNAPFGLSVDWADKDDFTGRAISTFSGLTAIDLNPSLGWQATPKLGIGFGVIARFSDVELENRQFATDFFTGAQAEVAKSRLEGGRDEGFGWNLGILHRWNNSFSWGLSYRSTMEIDYSGQLTLNQIPTNNPLFDALLQQFLPFDQGVPGKTAIEFPDIASLGLAFALSPSWLMEVDVNWTGWSTFDKLVVEVNSPTLPDGTPTIEDLELVQDWDDVFQYRLGLRWNSSQKSQWRFGYIYDETPQPEKSVSPVLPDSNRNDFTFGYGHQGGRISWDLAVMYVLWDDRTVSLSPESEVPYFGTYSQEAWLLSASIGF
jgi:long-chain fatty acid transport protein